MNKTQQINCTTHKASRKAKPRFIVTHEYSGSQSMRGSLLSRPLKPRLAVSLNPGLKRSAGKMPVEKIVISWYHGYIVSLFIKEINDEQEK